VVHRLVAFLKNVGEMAVRQLVAEIDRVNNVEQRELLVWALRDLAKPAEDESVDGSAEVLCGVADQAIPVLVHLLDQHAGYVDVYAAMALWNLSLLGGRPESDTSELWVSPVQRELVERAFACLAVAVRSKDRDRLIRQYAAENLGRIGSPAATADVLCSLRVVATDAGDLYPVRVSSYLALEKVTPQVAAGVSHP
jgi:hypothetical protein